MKATVEGSADMEPTTLHAFCLSTLMHHTSMTDLPQPLRIPDDWETKKLIRRDIARRLRGKGFNINTSTVSNLEAEMSARWESLDPEYELLTEVDPKLRNNYLAVWGGHRSVFGYSLFAEMPLKAGELIKDHDDLGFADLKLLIVDEYQDLNKCEIELLKDLGAHGVSVLAVGDDDQSVYGFRMADPAGIREFEGSFVDALNYELSLSMRCCPAIIDAGTTLIETAPNRPAKKRLRAGPGNPDGVFKYLSFDDQVAERKGVLALIEHMMWQGLESSEIAVLMRGDYNNQWSQPLRELLDQAEIPAVDVEAALSPLRDKQMRRALAIARLTARREDDLAWWALLWLTSGISDEYINALADEALANSERFWTRLARIAEEPVEDGTTNSWNATVKLVQSTRAFLDQVAIDNVAESENGWADYLSELCDQFDIDVSDEFRAAALAVGRLTAFREGLTHYLNQLEPVTKDIALLAKGVAIMSMQRSKGLTFRGTVVIGVENGVVPHPKARDEEEERRLLYVAITRAKEFTYLTMARRRSGPTARTGGQNVGHTRGRCPFFSATDIEPVDGRTYIKTLGKPGH